MLSSNSILRLVIHGLLCGLLVLTPVVGWASCCCESAKATAEPSSPIISAACCCCNVQTGCHFGSGCSEHCPCEISDNSGSVEWILTEDQQVRRQLATDVSAGLMVPVIGLSGVTAVRGRAEHAASCDVAHNRRQAVLCVWRN